VLGPSAEASEDVPTSKADPEPWSNPIQIVIPSQPSGSPCDFQRFITCSS
jgi:hypothetical protein